MKRCTRRSARPFLSLGAEGLRLRFGVRIPPAAIEDYVARIDFDTGTVFGIRDVAMMHVARTPGMRRK